MSSLAIADPFKGLDPGDENWLREQTDAILAVFRRTVENVIAAGRIIAEVKARLGHGYYLTWVAAALPFSADTAGRMMQVAEAFGDEIPHTAEFDVTALYLLAQPTTPAEARELALKLAADGHHITYAVARKILQQVRPGPTPDTARSPRTVVSRETLRLLIPDGQREFHASFDLSLDPDGDLIVSVGGITGRDLGEALTALVERQRRPAAAPPAIDPAGHLDWCDGVAGGVAKHHGLRRGQHEQAWEDVRAAGRQALLQCCQRFDASRVRADSTVEDAFRGWAHQYIRQACDREAKRERSGGTFHTKRDDLPSPTVEQLGDDL